MSLKFFSRLQIILFIAITIVYFGAITPTIFAHDGVHNDKLFTKEELAQFDGKNGRKAYYAYEGHVYDVTGSKLWQEGQHFGLEAGQDLTGKMGEAPHGTEVFAGFEIVGTYDSPQETAPSPAQSAGANQQPEVVSTNNQQPARAWYEGRLKILNISILGWTGILLGIFFVLTFATCFAMPWAKLPLPWAGSKPGPDKLDSLPKHMTWSYIHKYFVWFTVILGLVHGILGFLQLLGIYL